MKFTIMLGNAIESLKKLPDESVDCIVSSPPYYGLRSYRGAETVWENKAECDHEWLGDPAYHDNLRFRGENSHESINYKARAAASQFCAKCGAWKGQLGLEPTYQLYLDHLMAIMSELKRVLKKTGTLFWNMGDSYAGNMGKRSGWHDDKYSTTREESVEKGVAVFLRADYGNIKTKSLMMLPERFALRMIDDGWILRNKIIWYKRNGMPSSVKDRLSSKHEIVYFFTKSPRYHFDLASIRRPLAESSIKRISQSNIEGQFLQGKVHDFGELTHTGNMKTSLLNLKRSNASSFSRNKSGAYQSNKKPYLKNNPHNMRLHPEDYGISDAAKPRDLSNPKGANPGDVMDIPTRPHAFAHFAVFPETLVAPFVKAGCPPDGIVLDPFSGSGTTGVVAKTLGRSAILCEIVPSYIDIIKKRLAWGDGLDVGYEVID